MTSDSDFAKRLELSKKSVTALRADLIRPDGPYRALRCEACRRLEEMQQRIAELEAERAEMVQAFRRFREINLLCGFTLRDTAKTLRISATKLSKWTAEATTGPPDFVD